MRMFKITLLTLELVVMTFLILLFMPLAVLNAGWYSEGIKNYVNKALDKAIKLDFCTEKEADELKID